MVQLVYCLKQRIKDLTGGIGADVVIDPVGGRYAERWAVGKVVITMAGS